MNGKCLIIYGKIRDYLLKNVVIGYFILTTVFVFIPICFSFILLNSIQGFQESVLFVLPVEKKTLASSGKDINLYTKDILAQNRLMERRLRLLIPQGPFLSVNTTENSFRLYQSRQLKLEGFCSTGSYVHLEADSATRWIFKTPKGILRVQGKTEFPVWKKPDWAFIEEGLPVPAPFAAERYEYGVLGDYALSLGDGYLIHGTLYKRQLGLPVTHGCIRMNDEDLENVYYSLQIGSKVFIF